MRVGTFRWTRHSTWPWPRPSRERARQVRDELIDAVIANMNYEGGCNPVNMTYLTGLGWKRQHEIVHQNAQNDARDLPPSGIPLGNIQEGFQFLHHYGKELGALSFPPDGAENQPYAFYDRWGDSFNTTTEFVVPDQARGLAVLAWLMAQTPVKSQLWTGAPKLEIGGVPEEAAAGQAIAATVRCPGLDINQARIVWEGKDQAASFGNAFTARPKAAGESWVEVEAQWPDGRRGFASRRYTVN